MTDLERAIAVIADLCGAGYPAVKETREELAEWAEEFTDRYFSRGQQRDQDNDRSERGGGQEHAKAPNVPMKAPPEALDAPGTKEKSAQRGGGKS